MNIFKLSTCVAILLVLNNVICTLTKTADKSPLYGVAVNDRGFILRDCLQFDTTTALEAITTDRLSAWEYHDDISTYTRKNSMVIEYIVLVPQSTSGYMLEHMVMLNNGPSDAFELNIPVHAPALITSDKGVLYFSTSCGTFDYGGLKITDASGDVIPSKMSWSSAIQSIVLRIGEIGQRLSYPILIDPFSSLPSWSAIGSQNNTAFGHAIGFGDFDGNTWPDILVTDPLETYNPAYPFAGTARVWSNTGNNVYNPVPSVYSNNNPDSNFGYSIAIGKVDLADNIDDLMIGAPREHDGGLPSPETDADSTSANWMRGAAYRLLGVLNAGISTTLPKAFAPTGGGNTGGRRFTGSAVGIGKVINTRDAIIGSALWTNYPLSPEGMNTVLTEGTGKAQMLVYNYFADQNAPDYNTYMANDIHFGMQLVPADVDGDGIGDLLVGAPRASNLPNKCSNVSHHCTNLGAVFVYLGKHRSNASFTGLDGKLCSQIVWGPHASSLFGKTIINMGDLNGDGKEDILIAAPTYNDDTGRIYIYYGSANTVTRVGASNGGLLTTPPFYIDGPSTYSLFGWSVAIMAEGGRKDLLVGAPMYGADKRGMVLVYKQFANGTYPTTPTYTMEGKPDEHFGWKVASADVNADTYADLLVSRENYQVNGARRGRVDLHLGVPVSDLVITAAVNPNSLTVIGSVSTARLTCTLKNQGPAVDSNGTLTILMSAILPVIGTPSWTGTPCTVNSQIITCSRSAAVNTVYTLTIDFDISTAPQGNYVFQVTGTGANYDPTPAITSVSFELAAVANLSLTATLNGTAANVTTVVAGQYLTYVYTVTNPAGPSPAYGVMLRSVLPSSLTVESVTSSQGSCIGNIDCDLGTIPKLGSATVTLLVRVKPSTTASDVTTVARVTSNSKDEVLSNNVFTFVTNVTQSADLHIRIATGSAMALAGEPLYFTISVTNFGPSDTTNIKFGTEWTSVYNVTSFTVDSGTCIKTSNYINCTITRIGGGNRTVLTLAGSIPSDCALTTMSVKSTATHVTADPDSTNNIDVNYTMDISRRSNMAVNIFGYPAPVSSGQTVTYTVTVMNRGPADAWDVKVDLKLPVRNNYATLVWNPTTLTRTYPGGQSNNLTVTLGTVVKDGYTSFRFSYTVVTADTTNPMVATAYVYGNYYSNYTSNINSVSSIGIKTGANLQGVLSVYPDPPVAGKSATVSFTVLNSGPDPAQNVNVLLHIPVGAINVTYVTPTNYTCSKTATQISCTINAGITMSTTVQTTFSMVMILNASYVGPITLSGSVNGTLTDIDLTNNNRTAVYNAFNSVGLNAAMLSSPLETSGGGEVTYTMSYGNTGPSTAHGIVVFFNYSTQLTVRNVSTIDGVCSNYTGGFRCNMSDLAVGSRGSIILKTIVSPTMISGTVYMTAAVSSNADADPQADNVVTRSTIVKQPNADLAIVASCPSNSSIGLNYIPSVIIFNAGPSTSTPIVNVTIPAGLVLKESTLNCVGTTGFLNCTSPVPLAPLSSLTARFTFTTTSMTVSTRTLTFYVSGSVADNEQSNNVAPCGTNFTIENSVDLAVSVTGQTTSYYHQSSSFSVQVINAGPGIAKEVVTVIDLPPVSSATLVGSIIPSSPNATCTTISAIQYRCTIATMEVSKVVQYLFKLYIVTEDAVTLTGSATATSDNEEKDNTDNTAPLTSSVVIKADVQLLLTPSVSTAYYLNSLTVAASLVNLGPSPAKNVVYTLTYNSTLLTATAPTGCTIPTAGTISCNIARIDPRGTAGFVPKFNVSDDRTGVCTFVGTATVTGDPDITNNVVEKNITLSLMADMFVAVSGIHVTVYPGTVMSSSVFIQNRGPTKASDVYLTCNRINAMSVIDSITGTQVSSCTHNTTTLTCHWLTFPRLTDTSFYIKSNISISATGMAGVICTATSASTDANSNNNVNITYAVPVLGHADISLSVKPSRTFVADNVQVEFSVALMNMGPATARSVSISMEFDTAFTVLSTSNPTYCTFTATTATCNLLDIASGLSRNTIVKAVVNSGSTGTWLFYRMNATSVTEDKVPENNNVGAWIQRGTACDLELALLLSPSPLPLGESATLFVNVINKEPVVANASLSISYESTKFNVTGFFNPSGTCIENVGSLLCPLGAVVKGATKTIRITVKLFITNEPNITVQASVAALNATDLDTSNNIVEKTVNVSRLADVSISATTNPIGGPFARDSVPSWNFRVFNRGPATALSNIVAIKLDQDVSLVSAPFECYYNGSHYICSVGPIPKLNSTILSFRTRVSAYADDWLACYGDIVNATDDPLVDDLNSCTVTRNTSSDSDPMMDSITFNEGVEVYLRDIVRVDAVVYNGGPAIALGVTVLYEPHPGMLLYKTPESSPNCELLATGAIRCNSSSVSLGGSVTHVFYCKMLNNTGLVATVNLTTAAIDVNTTNNVMNVTTAPLVPVSDLTASTLGKEIVNETVEGNYTTAFAQNTHGYLVFFLGNSGDQSAHEIDLMVDLGGLTSQVVNYSHPGCSPPVAGSNYTHCTITTIPSTEDMVVKFLMFFNVAGEYTYYYNATSMYPDSNTENSNGNYTVRAVAKINRPPARVVKEGNSQAAAQEVGIGAGVLLLVGGIAIKMGVFKRKRPVKKDDGIIDHLEEMERMDATGNLNEEEEAAMEDAGDIWVDKSEVTLDPTTNLSDANPLSK